MAVIRESDGLAVLAIKAMPATPNKGVEGYANYIYEAYDFIYKNYHFDISLAERDLNPNLKVFERKENAIRIVFDRVFREAHGHVVVNGPNKFNEYLRAKQMIKDQDLISIANRIVRDHQNLAQRLNPILQMHNAPIDVKANQLRDFFNNPNNRGIIEGVVELNLSNLNLRTIPEELNLFIGLENLYLHGNQIRELPANFLNNANALIELYLQNNQISELPANFLNNANALTRLLLENNQIRELPVNFLNNANALICLNLSFNQISELPANFLNNANALTRLLLENNQIRELPANFLNNANALICLNLSFNQISELPANFLNNANALIWLNLLKNPLKYQKNMYFHRIPLVQNKYRNELYILEHYKFYRFLCLVGNAVKLNQDSFRSGY